MRKERVKNNDLAEWLGVRPQYLSNLITGTMGVSTDRVLKISRKTGISTDDILRLRGGKYRGMNLRIKLIDAYRRNFE